MTTVYCDVGMHYPSVMSATGTHVVETERTQVYSLISAGTHGGTLFTGLFGSIILHHFGWGSVFNFLGELFSRLWEEKPVF